MYRDVKKKLLSVALCICMIIGMVQVVPRVKAAESATVDEDGYYTIKVAYKMGSGSESVRVKLASSTSFGFKNAPYTPIIADVRDSKNESITSLFQSKLAVANNGDNVNVGSFYCTLVPTSDSQYAVIDSEENRIKFDITPVEIASLIVNTGSSDNLVLKYANGGVQPTLLSVQAKLNDSAGTTVELTTDQYDVSKIIGVGRNLPSTISVKDNNNFVNEASVKKEILCDVAYDLGESRFIKLNQYSLPFTGQDLSSSVTMSLYDSEGKTVLSNASKATDGLKVYFNGSESQSVVEATTYTVEVMPSGGEGSTVQIGDKLYTGKFTSQFTVGLKTPTSFVIKAYDADAKAMKQLSSDTSDYMYRISLNQKDSEGNVYPSKLQVLVDGIELSKNEYDLRCVNSQGVEENPTKAGRYTLYITPKASTNYTGQAVVVYYVYSNLVIEKVRLEDAVANETNLSYTGKGRKVEELVVKDASGNLLTQDTNYKVEYWYYDNGWIQATGYDAAEMASVGNKRIVANGTNAYKGESVAWEYMIDKVHMTDSSEADHFALSITNGSTYDYTGGEIKPNYAFTYYGTAVPKEYYDEVWENNVNAGTATLTVRAKTTGPLAGSLSVNFSIRSLQLSNAECVGDGVSTTASEYSYTGSSVTPQLKIGNYVLTEGKDYVVESYKNLKTGEELTEAPSEIGSYSASIMTGTNSNIKGAAEIPYKIIQRDISNDKGASFYLNGGTSIEWNGGTTEPEVICGSMTMEKDTDYTVSYSNNTAPTTTVSASAIITGKGNFTGSKTIYFEITKRKISNVNVVVTPKVTGTVPDYAVTFTVKDQGVSVVKANLVEGIDCQITGITYETEDDYTPTIGDLNALKRAGIYTVTLEGLGNYEGTVDVEVSCGTNLADAEMKLGAGTYTYNGKEQYPSITITSSDGKKMTFTQGDDQTTSGFYPVFTRSKNENVPDGYENIYAGTVYVKAIGNTKNGYFGTTPTKTYQIGQLDIGYTQTLYEVDLSEDKNKASIDDKGRVHYKFTNRSIKPQEVVRQAAGNTAVSAAVILTKGIDYTVSYGDDCIRKGSHWVNVEGMGNYTGTIGCVFYIDSMSINDESIEFVPGDIDTYAEGVPTFELVLLGGKEKLVPGKDYTYNYTRQASEGSSWRDTYVYTITGLDNFVDSSRIEKIPVSKTTLKRATDFSNPQAGEVYISSWDYTELMVEPSDTTIATPAGFVLTYMKKDGTTYNLTSEDYEVSEFVPTMKPGKGSSMVVKGIGGFNGEVTFDVTLYTDISKAEFLKDEEGNYASVLSPGGSISVSELTDAITNNRLSDLVTFKNIWPDETGGVIDTSCYTVSVPNGYTPQIGKVTFTVAGNHENYYAGSQTFTVMVTGGLDNDLTRVEIGDDNIVPWEGETVTPGAVKVQVYAGNQRLTGGYVGVGEDIPEDWDYTVTFTNNSGIGLATATITGVNIYSGTVTKTFKITCPMSDLTIQMQDQEGKWEIYDGGSPEYLYKIDTNKNKPAVKLYYSMKDGSLRELSKDLYNITYNGYQSAGNANIVIGEPEKAEYQGILLGTNRIVNYTLTEIPLDTVTIEINNPNPTFTGNEMTASDIGLKLTYGSYTLGEADYTLAFKDATNADEVDGRAARVLIFARGNFSGTIEKEFHITAMPINSDTDINAFAENLIYTGNASVPNITINQVTGNIRTLKEGTDYKIIKYLDESKQIQQDSPFSDIGTYYVRVEGMGNYKSLNPYRDIPYQIITRELSDGVEVSFVNSDNCTVINGVPQCTYNGKEQKPSVQVVYNKKLLNGPDESNAEYNVEYTDNINAGKATVTVTGVGSFSGTKTVNFVIQPKNITGDDMNYRDSDGNTFADETVYAWTKDPVQPGINVFDNSINVMLTQGDAGDYLLSYYDDNQDGSTQVNAGQVTLTVKGQGNYTGSKEFTYYIGEDISKSYTLINGKNALSTEYNGLVQAPNESDISVVWGASSDLTDESGEKRYDIAYYKDGFAKSNLVTRDQIVNAGTYYVAVVGVPSKGTYAKSSEDNSSVYTITPRSIAPSYILVSGYDGSYYYTGQAIEPKGIAVEDTDLPVPDQGNAAQRRSVQLTNGMDFDLSYANNVSAGKASIIVTGKGNYTGSRVAYFNIVSSAVDGNNTWDGSSEGTGSISDGTTTIAAADIQLGYDNSAYNCMMYNGYERIPTVTINGKSSNDFIITASNNIRPGIATLTITGNGNNYTGSITKTYEIKADLSTYGMISAIADQDYTGYQITPYVIVTCGGNYLNQGSDYSVSYLNNVNVGKATVMVTAASNSYYVGTVNGSFNISNTAGGMEITGYASTYTYTGYAITPDVVVMMNGNLLNRGTDYVVSYSNNTNVGTATMTVTGIGSYSGTKTINYAIEAKNIENCLTTAVGSYQYSGSSYTPSVTVTDSSTGKTLVAGSDYTITYSNNTNPGTASITLTALSKNYSGSKVIPFKITSAAVSGLRTSSIKNNSMKLSWSKQEYADGYQICNSSNRVVATTTKNSYTVKGLTSCTTYKFKVRSYVENADGSVSYGNFSTAVSAKTLLNTPKLTAKSTGKGKVALTWTKVSKATGYEIYYSTKKDGIYTRLKTVSKSSSRKYVDSGLASGEKYYYTIRAYRTANGVKTYSNYNTIKSVKVK